MEAIIIFLALQLTVHVKTSQYSGTDEICGDIIPDGYLKYKPPPKQGRPLHVFVQFEVNDIDEINEESMDFRLHLYINAYWNDSRLNIDGRKATISYSQCYKHFWIPDVIFEEAKLTNGIGRHTTYFSFLTDNTLFHSKRYSFKVSCPMDFNRYPFDTQYCPFSVAFMTTRDSEALLKWLGDKSSPYKDGSLSKPIRMLKVIEPLQFKLADPVMNSTTKQFTESNFTYLICNFTFIRRLTGSIINIYAPSSLIVVVSWVTFWLRIDAASERVSLSITCLLTLCYQVQQYKSQLPPVNYLTGMDVWLFTCIFMVFSTLIEFAISYNIAHSSEKNETAKLLEQDQSFSTNCCKDANLETIETTESTKKSSKDCSNSDEKFNPRKVLTSVFKESKHVDVLCRFLFPLLFLLFIAIYLSYYL